MSDAEFAWISGLLPPPKRRGREPTDHWIILNVPLCWLSCFRNIEGSSRVLAWSSSDDTDEDWHK
jgi:hypothetical protein